jgi:type IV pilus assembly protein PilV
MVVIALWLLANAGLQLNALKFQQSAQSRLTALTLTSDLIERMEANVRGARDGAYALAATNASIAVNRDCAANSCSPAELAAFDIAQWTTRAATALVLNTIQVEDATPAGGLRTYNITMSWREAAGNRRYAPADGQSGGTAPTEEVLTLVTTKVIRNGPAP